MSQELIDKIDEDQAERHQKKEEDGKRKKKETETEKKEGLSTLCNKKLFVSHHNLFERYFHIFKKKSKKESLFISPLLFSIRR